MEKWIDKIIFRKTPFAFLLAAEIWDELSILKKIDILSRLNNGSLEPTPKCLIDRALEDKSHVVRFFALEHYDESSPKPVWQYSIDDWPHLCRQRANGTWHPGIDLHMEWNHQLIHFERLAAIALSDDCLHMGDFAKFISEGIEKKTMSEDECTELVTELVRNPNIIEDMQQESREGLEWYYRQVGFREVWRLTTCTPGKVHRVIACEFPTISGTYENDGSVSIIPEEILNHMSIDALGMLAYRRYEPLLDKLMETPEKYDKYVHTGWEMSKNHKTPELAIDTEAGAIKKLREELAELRSYMEEEFGNILDHIKEISPRRKGLFS